MGFLHTIVNNILDIVFPIYCLSCQKRGEYLCLNCLSESPVAMRESASWIFPMFDYRHPPIKKAIWFLKYNGKRNLASVFAEAIHGHILEELADRKTMENFNQAILIPIPISRHRRRERGFNQTELIAEALAKIDQNQNFTIRTDILIKKDDTTHQARIESRRARIDNIKDSFLISPKIDLYQNLKRKNIILLDDVTTTGATLSEARRILKEFGARKVIAFTVAH